ncbi:MAG: DnaD domain protein [Clostridia bacterium]|nr:DnaD domain protein [Clostridia bacterium]
MAKQNMTAWFMEEGVVAIPRNIIGLMEPLGLDFEDIGRIAYLLYCGCDNVKKSDQYSYQAAKALREKGLIEWHSDISRVDFTPMFNIIAENIGAKPNFIEGNLEQGEDLSYSEFIKDLEKNLARFLSVKDKVELQEISQRYGWSYELIKDMYLFYNSHFRRQYSFSFFCQMAFGSKVMDKESFMLFVEKLNYTVYKVTEIKRRLGHKNSPTEIEKECYLKWANEWKFTHEMIHLAVEQTLSASDPSFKYIDGILKNWQEAGIKTPEDFKKHNENRKKEKERKKVTKKLGQNVYGYIRNLNDLVE